MFKPVGSVLNSLPLGNKQRGAILAIRVRLEAQKAIEKIDLEPEILKSVRIASFKNKVLTVIAPPLVLAELAMRSGGLIEAINKGLGARIVGKLKLKTRN